jgi:hypothetical protein
MKMRALPVLAGFSLVTVGLCPAAELVTNPGSGTFATPALNSVFGYQFTVGSSALEVTKLGLWDNGQNGFVNAHSIGLWDSGQHLLGSVTVSAGALSQGTFYYVSLGTPVELQANTSYTIGVTYKSGDQDQLLVGSGAGLATFSSDVSSSGATKVASSATLVYPTINLSSSSYIGGSAEYSIAPIPEPSTVALLLLGGAFVVRQLRGNRKA